jgi:hypothetical protein
MKLFKKYLLIAEGIFKKELINESHSRDINQNFNTMIDEINSINYDSKDSIVGLIDFLF